MLRLIRIVLLLGLLIVACTAIVAQAASPTIVVLNIKGVQVQVDLTDATVGTHMIKLSPRNVEVPLGVMIDQVTPQNIKAVLRPSKASPPDAKSEP